MGQHADDAFDEILDEMDFREACIDAGINPNQEDAMDLLYSGQQATKMKGGRIDGQPNEL